MEKNNNIIKLPLTSLPSQPIIQMVLTNLPQILNTISEIYVLHRKDGIFRQIVQSRLGELQINKENFHVLVKSLTELSKTEQADPETKQMYRTMIRTLFEIFTNNMLSSKDFDNYINGV